MEAGGLISIDPGVRECGVATWHGGRLVDASLMSTEQACAYLREALGDVVIEMPKIWPIRYWRGDPNDVIELAYVVGKLEASARGCLVTRVSPQAWKGSAPKRIVAARSMARLDGVERANSVPAQCPAGKRHNVLDAVGIGLWKLGR